LRRSAGQERRSLRSQPRRTCRCAFVVRPCDRHRIDPTTRLARCRRVDLCRPDAPDSASTPRTLPAKALSSSVSSCEFAVTTRAATLAPRFHTDAHHDTKRRTRDTGSARHRPGRRRAM